MFIVVVLVYASGRGWCVPLQRSRREAPTDRALACGCSTMPGGGVDKVRACLCTLARSWMESACHPDQAPAGVCLCNGAAVKLRLREHLPAAAARRCEADVGSRCRLVSTSFWHLCGECLPPRPGTCRCFDFATVPP